MVKKAFCIAGYSIRQWLTDPRIISLFIFMIILIWNDLTVIGDLTGMTGIYTNPLIFPFFSSDPLKQLVLLSGVVFLFSDAPFINSNQLYVIARSKRRPWALGQVLYILLASALYFLILMGVSVLVLLPYASFETNGWGKIVNTLAQTNAGVQLRLQFAVSGKIVSNYTPLEAFGLSFLLCWGVGCFLGLVMFVINLKWNKRVGLVIDALILFLDLLTLNILPLKYFHFSPVSLSRLSVFDPSGASEYPTIGYGVAFFGVSVVVLSVLAVVSFQKTPIEIAPEV